MKNRLIAAWHCLCGKPVIVNTRLVGCFQLEEKINLVSCVAINGIHSHRYQYEIPIENNI